MDQSGVEIEKNYWWGWGELAKNLITFLLFANSFRVLANLTH